MTPRQRQRGAPVGHLGMTALVVGAYLAAVVLANLLVAAFGPAVAVINALALIALDLTARDVLHDWWRHRGLWPRMATLIGAGGLLSYLANPAAGPVAARAAWRSWRPGWPTRSPTGCWTGGHGWRG